MHVLRVEQNMNKVNRMSTLLQMGLLPRLPEDRVAEQAGSPPVAPPPRLPQTATGFRVPRRRPQAEHQNWRHSAEDRRGEGVRGAHREEGNHPRRGPRLVQRLRRQRRVQGSGTATCPRRQGSLCEGNCQVGKLKF